MQQPTRLDRYELGTVLGHGATGVVYLARDTKLDREVAVKVMNPEISSNKNVRALFHREAKAIAKLAHPNIIALHDYSGPESKQVYLVVERLRGRNLQTLVDEGAPLRDLLSAATVHEICLALVHAHEQGIIHRDLKPENIFIEPEGRVVLCDFGIARDYRSALSHTLASRNTALAGSPMYMSPEQILTPQEVGPSSDLFSLGSVLYYLATGIHAFAGASMPKVLKNVVEVKCPNLHETRPDLPAEFSRIVHKLLQRDPERRHGTARHLAADLMEFMRSQGETDPRRALAALMAPEPVGSVKATLVGKKTAALPHDTVDTLADNAGTLPATLGARKAPRTQVIVWSVIAATLILLAGVAVAEIDALSSLRTWLQRELSR